MNAPNNATSLALADLRHESWLYTSRKPGKVPPADSPSRPALALLWEAAHSATNKRRNLRTFGHCGHRFGVVYLGSHLCVMDWATRAILVRPPTSMAALADVLGSQDY